MLSKIKKIFSTPSKDKGFTLIELLVVISIISILASLLLANFIGVRQRGRDAQRKSDMEQIRSALELYRADNGSYPATTWVYGAAGDTWIPGLSPTYISKVPRDPIEMYGGLPWVANQYNYAYYSDAWCGNAGAAYILVAQLENKSDPAAGKSINYNGSAVCAWPGVVLPGVYTLGNP